MDDPVMGRSSHRFSYCIAPCIATARVGEVDAALREIAFAWPDRIETLCYPGQLDVSHLPA
jgi:hypothetical protein